MEGVQVRLERLVMRRDRFVAALLAMTLLLS